jgi:signal transduction histidine kinase
MVVWTFALPHLPEEGEPRGAGFTAYVVAFLFHWALLSTLSSIRLWRAGVDQPSVARTRMRLLAVAAGGLTAALFLLAVAGDGNPEARVATQTLALLTAIAFGLGLAPPRLLRYAWRMPEQRRLQRAVEALITQASSRDEILGRVLPPMASIVGAEVIVFHDASGEAIGRHEATPRHPAPRAEPVTIDADGARIIVQTGPYAPFFGQEELQLLRTLAALTVLALDRVRLFTQEHQTRLALERANDTMANFVSLAAHELRTPVTAIYGFVRTLNHLGDRLPEERRHELTVTLEQQTLRMALLVEQLLDLSRLDADVVEIVPERFRVRDRIDDLVATAAAERAAVSVEVGDELEVEADPNAFDRIVTNLITNAFRYGEPPVVVRAERSDRHLRVIVEDHGSGVPSDFVPDLFERFSRSNGGRERASGTGLGLAIARSYARAHGGDLMYEDAQPHGARFKLVLPTYS